MSDMITMIPLSKLQRSIENTRKTEASEHPYLPCARAKTECAVQGAAHAPLVWHKQFKVGEFRSYQHREHKKEWRKGILDVCSLKDLVREYYLYSHLLFFA